MNGIPHISLLRSEAIFCLSFVIMIFDDTSINDWNRQKVLERLTQVSLPAVIQPQIGTDWSTVGQIYWYTPRSMNPRYDLMELRSIEDWTLLKEFKSVPNVVDVSDFGGTVREYQVRVDPNKLVSYGLSIGQVEQQLASNNINAGGTFVEAGLQQMNVRTLGLFGNVSDIEETVLKTQKGTALRVKDIAEIAQGPKIRLGHMARTNHMEDGHIVDEPDVIQGVVLMRKGADAGPTLDAIHKKVDELNNGMLPPGVKVVSMLDRADLLRYTLHTVMHNLGEGMALVTIVLLLFLANIRAPIFTPQRVEGRLFRPMALTVAFALLGALTFSILIAPVLSSVLFRKGVREWHNPVMAFLTACYRTNLRWAISFRWITLGVGVAALGVSAYLAFSGVIGSEFLPHLDEGAIWARGALADSTSLTEGARFADQARLTFAAFPEATKVVSEVGRPDDGTDTGGFGNTEYFIDLKSKDQWRPVFQRNKEELIAAMDREAGKLPCALWNYSQPIEDNVGETITGTTGQLALKLFGKDLKTLDNKGDEVVAAMGLNAARSGSTAFRRPRMPPR
jgi:Cu/Ag efflux pump CusA